MIDPALAASLGEGVRVIKQDRGVFDAMPLSLITTRSIAELEEWVGGSWIRSASGRTCWSSRDGRSRTTGSGACCGSAGSTMRVDQRDERCVVVNVDPVTGERDPAVLKTLARRAVDLHRRLRLDRQPGPGGRWAIRSSADN